MDKYETGKPYPRPDLVTNYDACIARLIGSSFDALVCVDSPTAGEVQTFRDSFMHLHVKVTDSIPLIAVSYLDCTWTWDISINVAGISDIEANIFFESGSAVNLVLIDCRTKVIKAMRQIGLNKEIEQIIKDACREQRILYKSRAEAMSAINLILSKVRTQDIIDFGLMQEFKGR